MARSSEDVRPKLKQREVEFGKGSEDDTHVASRVREQTRVKLLYEAGKKLLLPQSKSIHSCDSGMAMQRAAGDAAHDALAVLQPISDNTVRNGLSQPQTAMTDHVPASTRSPSSSPSKHNGHKVRILWRGSLVLQDGVQLPGLSIISTHSPAAVSSQQQRHARKPTADVFGALPRTPSNDLTSPVLESSHEAQASANQDKGVGLDGDNEAESDLTLSIEMLRHAPLNLHTHNPLPGLFKSCTKGKGKGKDVAEMESELERDWIVSSSTSLSLDSAHWSTIYYFQRSLLMPPLSSTASANSNTSSFPQKVARLTISPPQQDDFASIPRVDKGKSRLLPPAAPFDVFATPPTEFAIVPVPVPADENEDFPSEKTAAISGDTLNTSKKRPRSTTAAPARLLRLAIAQRRPPPAPSPTIPGTSATGPSNADSTPNGTSEGVTPAHGTSTERGLSATKKRMAAAAAARSRTLTSSSSSSSALGFPLVGAALSSVQNKRPRLSGGANGGAAGEVRLDSASHLSNGRTRSVPNLARTRSENEGVYDDLTLQSAVEAGNVVEQPGTATSLAVTRTSVRQQIKKLTRYALLARGMVESSKHAGAASSTGKTTATSDEYVAVLRAVASAAETALKPELDALTPTGTPATHAATTATAAAIASLQDLPRLAACVQAFVQLYAPPLPRAAMLPPPQ